MRAKLGWLKWSCAWGQTWSGGRDGMRAEPSWMRSRTGVLNGVGEELVWGQKWAGSMVLIPLATVRAGPGPATPHPKYSLGTTSVNEQVVKIPSSCFS